jgi:hypothetical protein
MLKIYNDHLLLYSSKIQPSLSEPSPQPKKDSSGVSSTSSSSNSFKLASPLQIIADSSLSSSSSSSSSSLNSPKSSSIKSPQQTPPTSPLPLQSLSSTILGPSCRKFVDISTLYPKKKKSLFTSFVNRIKFRCFFFFFYFDK